MDLYDDILALMRELTSSIKVLKENGEDAYIMGEIVKGDSGVVFC